MSDDFFDWSDAGPLSRSELDTTIRGVQDRLDVLTVLEKRYGAHVAASGTRWRTACFLRSTVDGFAGTCAEQDSAASHGTPTRNLWVSEGELTRVWRCHSCQRRGDVVDLIEHADGLLRNPGQSLSLRAVRAAANLAGVAYLLDGCKPRDSDNPSELVDVAALKPITRAPVRRVSFAAARALNLQACELWCSALNSGPGRAAREELASRGVTPKQIKRYRIGFAKAEWRVLSATLTAKNRDDALALGLVGRTRQGKLYDRQRNRLVFSYCDPADVDAGKPAAITGFAGRRLDDADPNAPKWLNSVNAPGVWEKGSALIGLYQAAKRIASTGCAAVGEGAWEVLAFDRARLPCVGLVSAAFTASHAAVLVRLGARRILLAFDGDATGRDATIAAAVVLLRQGFKPAAIGTLDCADNTDPAELDAPALLAAWTQPTSLVAFARAHPTAGKQEQRRALLEALPPQAAERRELSELWEIELVAKQAGALDTSSPTQRLAALLLDNPDDARCLTQADVVEALSSDPLAFGHVEALAFGSETNEQALTPAVRRAWLHARYTSAVEKLTAHDKANPFSLGPTTADFRRFFAQGEALRKRAEDLRKSLA